MVSPASALTMPAWARGGDRHVGPLRARRSAVLVRLLPHCQASAVYFAGDPQPAFLFHLHERPFRPGELIDVAQVLSFFQRNRYTLDSSSVWIRADLLAGGSPPASYVGLKVRGGSLAFSPPVTIETDRLTIPPGGTCSIHLDLEAPAVPAPGGGASGKDAADATLYLPGLCEIDLANGHATITRVGDARWTLYGQPVTFSARPNPTPTWEPALLSVFVPFTVSEPAIELRAVASPFATPRGRAGIERGGWTLPVATIDVARPVDAAGIGGLAVRAKEAFDDRVARTSRRVHDAAIALGGPGAWADPGDRHRSDRCPGAATAAAVAGVESTRTIDRRSANAEPGQLIYLVAATGSEVVIAVAAAQARLDRPVDVRGHRCRSTRGAHWRPSPTRTRRGSRSSTTKTS